MLRHPVKVPLLLSMLLFFFVGSTFSMMEAADAIDDFDSKQKELLSSRGIAKELDKKGHFIWEENFASAVLGIDSNDLATINDMLNDKFFVKKMVATVHRGWVNGDDEIRFYAGFYLGKSFITTYKEELYENELIFHQAYNLIKKILLIVKEIIDFQNFACELVFRCSTSGIKERILWHQDRDIETEDLYSNQQWLHLSSFEWNGVELFNGNTLCHAVAMDRKSKKKSRLPTCDILFFSELTPYQVIAGSEAKMELGLINHEKLKAKIRDDADILYQPVASMNVQEREECGFKEIISIAGGRLGGYIVDQRFRGDKNSCIVHALQKYNLESDSQQRSVLIIRCSPIEQGLQELLFNLDDISYSL